jgi:hypothetical protein
MAGLQQRLERSRDGLNMCMRIGLTGASEADERVSSQSKLLRDKRMLVREDNRRHDAARLKRLGNGPHLDGFRPGADDQPDVAEPQSSP